MQNRCMSNVTFATFSQFIVVVVTMRVTIVTKHVLFTGERPYKCHLPDCGRAFIQLSNLQQHLRNHDAQVERAKNRPFHCNICGKGFATESSLRTHTSKVSSTPNKPKTSKLPTLLALFPFLFLKRPLHPLLTHCQSL